jgi:hypothetical protein
VVESIGSDFGVLVFELRGIHGSPILKLHCSMPRIKQAVLPFALLSKSDCPKFSDSLNLGRIYSIDRGARFFFSFFFLKKKFKVKKKKKRRKITRRESRVKDLFVCLFVCKFVESKFPCNETSQDLIPFKRCQVLTFSNHNFPILISDPYHHHCRLIYTYTQADTQRERERERERERDG